MQVCGNPCCSMELSIHFIQQPEVICKAYHVPSSLQTNLVVPHSSKSQPKKDRLHKKVTTCHTTSKIDLKPLHGKEMIISLESHLKCTKYKYFSPIELVYMI